jgi:hypothetical protein
VASLQEAQRRLAQMRIDEDRVLTFKDWCVLNGFSERTGRRIIDSPDRPTITRLSPRRIGISVRNHRIWAQSREQA